MSKFNKYEKPKKEKFQTSKTFDDKPRGPRKSFSSDSRKSSDGSKSFDNRKSFDGPRRNFDNKDSQRRSFDRTSEPKMTKGGFQLYHAVCESCGNDCDLPFKPTGSKPVLCRSCFRSGAEPRSQGNRQDDLEKINRKLDKIMRALKID